MDWAKVTHSVTSSPARGTSRALWPRRIVSVSRSESAEDFRGEEERHRGGHAGGGIGGEEDGAGGGVRVLAVAFGDEAGDGKRVAENTDAALGYAALLGDGGGGLVAVGEGSENVEFDGGAEGGGALVSGEGVSDEGGVGFRHISSLSLRRRLNWAGRCRRVLGYAATSFVACRCRGGSIGPCGRSLSKIALPPDSATNRTPPADTTRDCFTG